SPWPGRRDRFQTELRISGTVSVPRRGGGGSSTVVPRRRCGDACGWIRAFPGAVRLDIRRLAPLPTDRAAPPYPETGEARCRQSLSPAGFLGLRLLWPTVLSSGPAIAKRR